MKNYNPRKLALISGNTLLVYNDKKVVSGPYEIDWKLVTVQEIEQVRAATYIPEYTPPERA